MVIDMLRLLGYFGLNAVSKSINLLFVLVCMFKHKFHRDEWGKK